MSSVLRLYISEEGADAEWLDTLSGYLRADLTELDVYDVAALPTNVATPPGARSGAVADVGGLLVSLGDAAGGLASLVSAVRAWLRRGEAPQRTVRLELDGDVLELSQPTPADQERVIELFLSRHQRGTDG
jgi:hypothetical protein